jgi:hypothetical protein
MTSAYESAIKERDEARAELAKMRNQHADALKMYNELYPLHVNERARSAKLVAALKNIADSYGHDGFTSITRQFSAQSAIDEHESDLVKSSQIKSNSPD